MTQKNKRAFPFVRMNERPEKPRKQGLTEIRGPYYAVMGKNYLQDILSTMGPYVDALKFSAGSFTLMAKDVLQEIIGLAHQYHVEVSTGGFAEYILAHTPEVFEDYVKECKKIGFDIVELSAGFISLSIDDWLRLVEKVQKAGLKAKPEIGIQFGAGGATRAEMLEAMGQQDPKWMIQLGKKFLDAGVYMLMIESEGITENVKSWRTDVVATIINELGLEKVMFEAADPEVFGWYIKNYGPEVNLFVDHSQIVQLETLRRGIWGTQDVWGRIVTYKK